MAVLKLKITTKRPTAYLTSVFQTAGGNRAILNRIALYIRGIIGGTELAQDTSTAPQCIVTVQNSEVQASGTVTFSAAATANDTILINGVTFTAKASGAVGNQFNVGTAASTSASNFATAVNASVTSLVSGYVSASASAGTGQVTLTSAFYGLSGNQCTTAEGVDAGSVITVSGARLISGAADAGELTLNF